MSFYPYDLHISFGAGVVIDNRLIFSSNMFNGLMEYDLESKKTHFMGMFDNEFVLALNLHQKAFRWHNKIVFVSMHATHICIFDINSGEYDYVKIDEWQARTGIESAICGDMLWIFFTSKKYFAVCIDLNTHEVFSIKAPEKEAYSDYCKEKMLGFSGGISISEEYAYLPLWADRSVVRFNMVTMEYDLIRIDMENLKLTSAAVYEDYIYFTSYQDWNVYCYHTKTKVIECISGNNNVDKNNGFYYSAMAVCGGKVCVFPEFGETILTIKDGSLIPLCTLPEGYGLCDDYYRKRRKRFYRYDIDGTELLVFPYSTNMTLRIDTETGKCHATELLFDEDYIDNLFLKVYRPAYIKKQRKMDVVSESRFFKLNDYLIEI